MRARSSGRWNAAMPQRPTSSCAAYLGGAGAGPAGAAATAGSGGPPKSEFWLVQPTREKPRTVSSIANAARGQDTVMGPPQTGLFAPVPPILKFLHQLQQARLGTSNRK